MERMLWSLRDVCLGLVLIDGGGGGGSLCQELHDSTSGIIILEKMKKSTMVLCFVVGI